MLHICHVYLFVYLFSAISLHMFSRPFPLHMFFVSVLGHFPCICFFICFSHMFICIVYPCIFIKVFTTHPSFMQRKIYVYCMTNFLLDPLLRSPNRYPHRSVASAWPTLACNHVQEPHTSPPAYPHMLEPPQYSHRFPKHARTLLGVFSTT